MSLHRSWNIDCELVTPEEAKRLCPLIAVDDLQGGLWIPGDGVGDPYQICLSLISAAKEGGKALSKLIVCSCGKRLTRKLQILLYKD
jgi:glycine/D-amino acid oxidase-like deaminating enzyme